MNEPLFSYGTLQLPNVQLALFDRLLEARDDALIGFSIVQIEIRDPDVLDASGIEIHSALVPAEGSCDPIHGKVFELTPDELARADVYESENYRRELVPLASGRSAWVYVKA